MSETKTVQAIYVGKRLIDNRLKPAFIRLDRDPISSTQRCRELPSFNLMFKKTFKVPWAIGTIVEFPVVDAPNNTLTVRVTEGKPVGTWGTPEHIEHWELIEAGDKTRHSDGAKYVKKSSSLNSAVNDLAYKLQQLPDVQRDAARTYVIMLLMGVRY